MKAKLLILATVLIFSSVKSFAGWYDTYNYTGLIGKYPVTLSIQIKTGYFGEAAKKHYNIIGVYKYDKFNQPIRLEGFFDQHNRAMKVQEIGANGQTSATFQLSSSAQKLTGTWSNGKSKLKVELQLLDKLSDLSDEAFHNIQVLQFSSLKNYYFIGIYAKEMKSSQASMRALKIVSKETNKTFQILNFDHIERPTGCLMTIIYDNVMTVKNNDFLIYNMIGRVGGYLNVDYNIGTKRFILNPEPVAEGANGSN